VKNADSELGKLAVFNELAQVSQRILFRIGYKFDQVKHALHNSTLELIAALITQDAAEEGQHASLLAWELEAQRPDSLHDGDLELVCDFRHEAGNLLHQPVDTSFIASLEESGNGECSNRPVRVGDEELDIRIADVDSLRLECSKVVEDAKGGKFGDGTRRCKEELQDVHGLVDFSIADIAHVTDRLGCLEVDHLALVTEPAIQQLHHRLS
jgi:hypothetical protein